MPDDNLGTGTESTTPAGDAVPAPVPAPDSTPDSTPDPGTTPQATPAVEVPPPPAGGQTYTQADIDAAAASARRKAEAANKAMQEKLAALEAEAEEKRKAELTESERLREEAEAAKAAREKAETDLAKAKLSVLRADIILRDAPDLPNAYKDQVKGADEDAIKASITAVREQYAADVKAVREQVFSELAATTPEQFAEKYPDSEAAKALAARLEGKPVAIGGPSNATETNPPAPRPTGTIGEMDAKQMKTYLAGKGVRVRGI